MRHNLARIAAIAAIAGALALGITTPSQAAGICSSVRPPHAPSAWYWCP